MTATPRILHNEKPGYALVSIRANNTELCRIIVHTYPDGVKADAYIDVPEGVFASYMRPIPDDGDYKDMIALHRGDAREDCKIAYEHVHLRMKQRAPIPTTLECGGCEE